MSASDVKKLVVRTTTNFEIDQDVVSRITSEAELSNFPVNNLYFSEYQNPQPSTSYWFQDTQPYGTNQPQIQKVDPLSLENSQSSLPVVIIPHERISVPGSDPYSPETEPISPYSSEPDASDILANCVRVAGLDNKEEYDLDQMREEEQELDQIINDKHVLENQIIMEQDQAENYDNEVQFVGEHQVVYDVDDDDDLQITFAYIKPRQQVPVDWKDRLKKIKKERME